MTCSPCNHGEEKNGKKLFFSYCNAKDITQRRPKIGNYRLELLMATCDDKLFNYAVD